MIFDEIQNWIKHNLYLSPWRPKHFICCKLLRYWVLISYKLIKKPLNIDGFQLLRMFITFPKYKIFLTLRKFIQPEKMRYFFYIHDRGWAGKSLKFLNNFFTNVFNYAVHNISFIWWSKKFIVSNEFNQSFFYNFYAFTKKYIIIYFFFPRCLRFN